MYSVNANGALCLANAASGFRGFQLCDYTHSQFGNHIQKQQQQPPINPLSQSKDREGGNALFVSVVVVVAEARLISSTKQTAH